jgi:hypothetical protein
VELYAYGQTDRETAVITWWECSQHDSMNLLILKINMARPRDLILHGVVQQHMGRGS